VECCPLDRIAAHIAIFLIKPTQFSPQYSGDRGPFGLTNDGIESGVGLYIDDVFYARPASAAFDFIDLESLEIVRGPQGTLYGKNTTAGAINLRRPRLHSQGR
jgi:iron complex outermembrane receptor protein